MYTRISGNYHLGYKDLGKHRLSASDTLNLGIEKELFQDHRG